MGPDPEQPSKRYRLGRLAALTRRGPGPRMAILRAGFGGLAVAVALRRAGIDTFTIFEAADGSEEPGDRTPIRVRCAMYRATCTHCRWQPRRTGPVASCQDAREV